MKVLRKAITLAVLTAGMIPLVSLAAAEKTRFEPQKADEYPAHQTSSNVTVAADPYESGPKVKDAFGKLNPAKLGILPVLLVIQNDSDTPLQLDRMRVQWITADRQRFDSVSAEDAQRSGPVRRPEVNPRPSPIPGIGRGSRRPKDEKELAALEFVAPVVMPHSKAHGFFYFPAGKESGRIAGSKIYITGIRDARSGRELLYFELALDSDQGTK
jgi:hypothetical protein